MATFTEYAYPVAKEGNLVMYKAVSTAVGAADTNIVICRLPERLDNVRYRVMRWVTMQNSGAAATVLHSFKTKAGTDLAIFPSQSTTSAAFTDVDFSQEQFLYGGSMIYSYSTNLGAGKYIALYVTVELIDSPEVRNV